MNWPCIDVLFVAAVGGFGFGYAFALCRADRMLKRLGAQHDAAFARLQREMLAALERQQ